MTQYLMEKQVRHTLSRVVFLVTFSCSLSLLSMYLFEIMKFPIGEYYWYTVLIVLVLMCEIVIPLCLISRLPFNSFKFIFLGVQVPVLTLIASLIYIGIFVNIVWK